MIVSIFILYNDCAIALLHLRKETLATVIEHVTDSIREQNPDRMVEIQLVAYRNYSSHPNDLLDVSPWATSPLPLLEFFNKVQVSGG